ncbi:hypothetical protein AlacWU_01833 [Aspergillus niger]|nr:hypothetical protein AlacWU_01833 [Aspergillus niger]GLA27246.1 hypothetical protein AnigIFM63326_004440 [Aspergillus niger]
MRFFAVIALLASVAVARPAENGALNVQVIGTTACALAATSRPLETAAALLSSAEVTE